MTKLEEVARAICWNRGGPACDCRKLHVKCQAPIQNLLEYNPIGSQARGALDAIRHATNAMIKVGTEQHRDVRFDSSMDDVEDVVKDIWEAMVGTMIEGKD